MNQFKIGDTVRCKYGFTKEEDSGGSGYAPDKVFVVGRITEYENRTILWPKIANGSGIYAEACEIHLTEPLDIIIFNLRKEIYVSV